VHSVYRRPAFFFFSSRRRHTRFSRDWSSDVCSSDLDENIAHVVDTAEELADWPHDPTGELRSRRHRLNWESLMLGFQTCERMARQEPDRYQRMSMNASQHMRHFCDTPVVARQLEDFLTPLLTPRHAGGAQ